MEGSSELRSKHFTQGVLYSICHVLCFFLGGHLQYKKISDLVDEDSSDALSPEQIPPAPAPSPPLTLQITTAFSSSLTNSIADRTSTVNKSFCVFLHFCFCHI